MYYYGHCFIYGFVFYYVWIDLYNFVFYWTNEPVNEKHEYNEAINKGEGELLGDMILEEIKSWWCIEYFEFSFNTYEY